ncbi:MAG: hypothetical protein MPJ08_01135 [Nitrosopumilus sp.]|nr:hypothetical protein [Nitrosopumilus sp.]
MRWSEDQEYDPEKSKSGLISTDYPEIPSHCIISSGSSRQISAIIYKDRMVTLEHVTDRSDAASNDAAGLHTHGYMHAYVPKRITFVGMAGLTEFTRNASGIISSRGVYHVTDIILGQHYACEPEIGSVKIMYPVNWGRAVGEKGRLVHDTVKVLDGRLTIEIMEESEHISKKDGDHRSRERFVIYRIISDPPMGLYQLMEYVTQFNCLITLLVGHPMYPRKIWMWDSDGGEFLYYPNTLFAYYDKFQADLFGRTDYELIEPHFARLLQEWFRICACLGSPVPEYFESALFTASPRARFVDHTNTLQRLYKKICKAGMSLQRQLDDAAGVYAGIHEMDDATIRRIKKTRNHYVHNSPDGLNRDVVTSRHGLSMLSSATSMLIEGKILSMAAGFDRGLLEMLLGNVSKRYSGYRTELPGLPRRPGDTPSGGAAGSAAGQG